jgi:hypothetical protein
MSESEQGASPQFSADRQWWWTGTKWVPAAEAPNSTEHSAPIGQATEEIDEPMADPSTESGALQNSSANAPREGEPAAVEDQTPPYITGHNGLIVSTDGDLWWNGSKWHSFDKKPAEAQPSVKGPKLGFKEAMASPGLAKQYRLATGAYPMHPLGKKESAQMAQALLPGEKVLSQCVGMSGQSLVVTDQKVLIIKTGFMAGSTFGAKATTFDYRMISSVEVRTGPVTGALSISAGGVAQRDRTYWGQTGNDAYKSPDAIPIARAQAPDFQRAAALIRELAGRSHGANQPAAAGAPDPIEQLKKLAELRDAGVLTAAEFEAKKRELLSRM